MITIDYTIVPLIIPPNLYKIDYVHSSYCILIDT